jgi:predicted transcriptional regulator
MLLEKGERASSRLIATEVNAPLYSVRRSLKALRELGLIARERIERGYLTFDYWLVKKRVCGILRIVPEKYFKDHSLFERAAQ